MIRKAGLVSLFLAAISVLGISHASAASVPPDSALHGIASVILNLNHRPSSAEERELQQILDSDTSTSGERTLAKALIEMNHRVSGSNKQELQALTNDDSADPVARDLADILLGINHHPSSSAKDRLRSFLQ